MYRFCGVLIFVLLLTATGAVAAVDTVNNNFTMIDSGGNTFGGANDVHFTWDGTTKTSVAATGQVSNATIASTCPFFGQTWSAHDVAIYGPGTYTVYDGCAPGSPGCGTGNPVTFTVGAGQLGGHMLFNWNNNNNIDVVDVWKTGAFAPSALWTGACGSNSAGKIWDLMSTDVDGDGINGAGMTDGPFAGSNANFNLMGLPVVVPAAVDTLNNNFTMLDPGNNQVGGTNDVHFTWDGTKKATVAASNQVSNATISSVCSFFGMTWAAHDVAIYGPGTYTVYADCPAGSPGCGVGTPITFTVGANEIGGHMLFYWNGNDNMDVVNIWRQGIAAIWTAGCGSNSSDKVWDWMSYDGDGDGVNGSGMVDGPFTGMNSNFNLMGVPPVNPCDDNNVCTTDTLVSGVCQHTPVVCSDGSVCTTDSCDPVNGCVFTPTVTCNDNNACTTDTCDPATGGCVFAPKVCNDNSACTTDTCDPATGCVYTSIDCDDNNACTTDLCIPATGGCVSTPVDCDDSNSCTTDACDPATGQCVHTAISNCNSINNFTMIDGGGNTFGGTNDVAFTWDGTKKTSVAVSGQVPNATITSACPFFGLPWAAHDVAIYGPGTYTVYADCPAGSPGCGMGTPVTFTVGANEIGGHMLFYWNSNDNMDVVNVWSPNVAFAPSTMWTDGCSSNPAATIWSWMSKDFDGDGINGAPMVDGPFVGSNANFNLKGSTAVVDTTNNNFTMIDAEGISFGGTNDVHFTWDGTTKTSVAASGQVSNATLASTCPFFGWPWSAHDVAIYGPGTYTVYDGCAAGSPGCGAGNAVTFTVGTGQLGGHMLFDWGMGNTNMDVVNVWHTGMFAPSGLWTGGCGSNAADKVWDLMSTDWDGDGINGAPMTDGAFVGSIANFNLMRGVVGPCAGKVCDDGNACTTDTCDPTTGGCVYTPRVCNDNSACTTDTCEPATGCVYTPKSCDDNDACTTDTCDPATGGCIFTPITCDDGNVCTTDACDPATGQCVYTPISNCNSVNNFTIMDPDGITFGGTNDVNFTWDGTKKTSVAVSGQVSNATITDLCPFLGHTWAAHDVAIYGPGTYTVYSGCPAGSPGCGMGAPITFTVGPNEIGGHMLFYWNANDNMDVVNVWTPNAVFAPSTMWTYGCGFNPADKVWNWMSKDFDGDGINGTPMVDGPFVGTHANFNLMVPVIDLCANVACPAVMVCNSQLVCDPATGQCVPENPFCDDGNACTVDSCDPIAGCIFTPVVCNDANPCTVDACGANGCVYTPLCPPGEICSPDGACSAACPAGSVKTATIRGGGQNPRTVDLQIQTEFTVMNDGCIVDTSVNDIACSPGTLLLVNVKAGRGPMPTNCTWKGAAIGWNAPFTIQCPDVSGTMGRLICDNKDGGGKDADRITISVQ